MGKGSTFWAFPSWNDRLRVHWLSWDGSFGWADSLVKSLGLLEGETFLTASPSNLSLASRYLHSQESTLVVGEEEEGGPQSHTSLLERGVYL
jgi:hypothetical protein